MAACRRRAGNDAHRHACLRFARLTVIINRALKEIDPHIAATIPIPASLVLSASRWTRRRKKTLCKAGTIIWFEMSGTNNGGALATRKVASRARAGRLALIEIRSFINMTASIRGTVGMSRHTRTKNDIDSYERRTN
jgi:hypothetical protein